MTAGWDIGADSPLLPIADGASRRARFSLPVPAPADRPARCRATAGRGGRGGHHATARPAQGRLLAQRPHGHRVPVPPPGEGAAPAVRHRVAGARAVRPAGRVGRPPAAGGPGGGRADRRPRRRGVDRRHPHPRWARPVPRHRLLQPVRVQQAGLRCRLGPAARRAHRRRRGRRRRPAPPGPARLGHGRGVGPHPQPVAAVVRAQRRGRPPDGPPAHLRVGQPRPPPASGRRRGRRRGHRTARRHGRVLGARHRRAHARAHLQRRPVGLRDRRGGPPRRAHPRPAPGGGRGRGHPRRRGPGAAPRHGRPPRGPAPRPGDRRAGRRAVRVPRRRPPADVALGRRAARGRPRRRPVDRRRDAAPPARRRRGPRRGRLRERDAGDPPGPPVPARGRHAAGPTGPRAASVCSADRSSG